jgi:hypothetical protein
MRKILIAASMLVCSLACPPRRRCTSASASTCPPTPCCSACRATRCTTRRASIRTTFFYDGLYWVYEGDNWYSSPWYNGPWEAIDRYEVPVYLLRVPVRYYRSPPAYFHGWRADAAPHWGQHWGTSWAQRRYGWDQWNRSSAPAPAPLPAYQRQYSGARYPQHAEQIEIHTRSYNYQPREVVVQQRYDQYRGHPPGKAKGGTVPTILRARPRAGTRKRRPRRVTATRATARGTARTRTSCGSCRRSATCSAGPRAPPRRAAW